MKKFLPQFGGHRLRLDDFDLMQDSYIEAFKAVIKSLGSENLILNGLTESYSFGTYNYTAGWVSFLGEPFYVPAATLLPQVFGPGLYPRQFLKIVETVIPPSPVNYKDTVNKNVHFDRTMVIKWYDATAGDQNLVNGIYLDELYRPGIIQPGIITEWQPMYSGEENVVWDGTGLGIKRMKGYALCNGLNGTPDYRGMHTFMASSNVKNSAALDSEAIVAAFNGYKVGTRYLNITKANLPNYNLDVTITQDPHGHSTTENNHTHNLGYVDDVKTDRTETGDSNYVMGLSPFTDGSGAFTYHGNFVSGPYNQSFIEGAKTNLTVDGANANISVVVNSGGSATPLLNVPRSVATFKIMRIS